MTLATHPAAVRELPLTHQCLCVIVRPGPCLGFEYVTIPGHGVTMRMTVKANHHDVCTNQVDNPDQPVCDGCLAQGHFDDPHRVPFGDVLKGRRA